MTNALTVGRAAMDACWLYLWSLLLGTWEGRDPLLSFWSTGGLLLVPRLGVEALWRARARPTLARVALVGLGVVAVVAVVAIENGVRLEARAALALLLGCFLWWRGLTQTRQELWFEDVEVGFRLGVVGLVAFAVLGAATDPNLAFAAVPYVLAFFSAGLLSLALARRATASERVATALNRQWLGALVGTVAVLLTLTLLVAELLTFDAIAAVWNPVGDLLGTLLFWVVVIVALPVALLLELVVNLLRPLLNAGPRQPMQAADLLSALRQRGRGEPIELPPDLQAIAQWVAVALIAAAVLVILWRAIAWWREMDDKQGPGEERDSVWSWAEVRGSARAWLSRMLARFWHRRAQPAAVAPGDRPAAVPPAVATIREIYRAALALGAARGRPRRLDLTPYEHLPGLRAALGRQMDALTDTYVDARYGGSPPTPAAARAAQASWTRIREGEDDGS